MQLSSFFLFGLDLKSPTAAAFLPPDSLDPTDLGSYQQELVLSLSLARELAESSTREAQRHYKCKYNKKAKNVEEYQLGDCIFPKKRLGRNESCLSHGMVHSE